MKSVNEITLIGNMGEKPKLRSTRGGAKVAEFPLATSRRWTTSAGEEKEATQWHRCVAWNSPNDKLAELVDDMGRKGARCYIRGRMEYRSYKRDNADVWVSEVLVLDFIVLDPAPASV